MRLALQLARRHGRTVPLPELAAAEGIQRPVAAKVLLRLRRGGVVVAARGRAGGYVLAGSPDEITVARVLRAVGEPLFGASYCHKYRVAADQPCSRVAGCSLRPVWAGLEAMLGRHLDRITLADLLSSERAAPHPENNGPRLPVAIGA